MNPHVINPIMKLSSVPQSKEGKQSTLGCMPIFHCFSATLTSGSTSKDTRDPHHLTAVQETK